jgi:hypothetical protein
LDQTEQEVVAAEGAGGQIIITGLVLEEEVAVRYKLVQEVMPQLLVEAVEEVLVGTAIVRPRRQRVTTA